MGTSLQKVTMHSNDNASFGEGRGEKRVTRVDLSCGGRFAAVKGFGPNRVDIRAQGDASLTRKKESPSKFLNFGMGRAIKEEEGCKPKSVWEVGQPNCIVDRALVSDWVNLGGYLKGGRALRCRLLPKGWDAEEEMFGKARLAEAEGALDSGSSTNTCLMEEASKYSTLSPSSFCV